MALTETPLQTLVFQLEQENTNLLLQIKKYFLKAAELGAEKAHLEAKLFQLQQENTTLLSKVMERERSIVEFIVKAAKFRAKLDDMAVQIKREADEFQPSSRSGASHAEDAAARLDRSRARSRSQGRSEDLK